ncbi:hypothetical protein EK904_001275 [Melospiza melodia maxima]|nr:hypothetical protein EK904_001275 [Melospiza melodia maxima]
MQRNKKKSVMLHVKVVELEVIGVRGWPCIGMRIPVGMRAVKTKIDVEGGGILPCEKTVPWELKGLVSAVYWQKNLRVSTFASGQIETAAFGSFPLFCFVMIISVPSFEF